MYTWCLLRVVQHKVIFFLFWLVFSHGEKTAPKKEKLHFFKILNDNLCNFTGFIAFIHYYKTNLFESKRKPNNSNVEDGIHKAKNAIKIVCGGEKKKKTTKFYAVRA